MTLEEPRYTGCARRLAHERNAVRVAPNGLYILAHPLEGKLLVKDAQVTFSQRDSIRSRERETEDIRAIVNRNHYDVLVLCQTCLIRE